MARPIDLLRKEFKQFKKETEDATLTGNAVQRVKCYVCGRHMPRYSETTITISRQHEIYRHEDCQAGSPSWWKHRRSKSEMKEFFK